MLRKSLRILGFQRRPSGRKAPGCGGIRKLIPFHGPCLDSDFILPRCLVSSLRCCGVPAVFSFAALLLSGCAMGTMNGPESVPQSAVAPRSPGVVHGGQQPVSGATIQLYSVNTTTDLGASTPLLTSSVTTASDGSFTITNLYTCPTSNPLVYLLSTGGNPGLSGTVNNADISLMTAIGTCSTLMTTPFIAINELTTVAAAAYFIGPFHGDAGHYRWYEFHDEPGDRSREAFRRRRRLSTWVPVHSAHRFSISNCCK